ncbi:hypothetical protein [Rubinisphaera margarita]|uniref:hypothetical protein n=1 Tax=Rubinisphaera margarita TaxID=2909586 RepID=UPI001EE7FC20|nr:hypothetical protein [Rubinisphaera margarita]MCG6156594.1 hypothetical protein [Rubinisphaera margarita]
MSFIYKTYPRLCVVAASLLLSVFSGCISSKEDEEHGEHVIPAHKPADFVVAVDILHSRIHSSLETEESVLELRDIIGWLPELAAQTDLAKDEWDRVHEVSRTLANVAWKNGAVTTDEIEREIDRLRVLADRAAEIDQYNSFETKDGDNV